MSIIRVEKSSNYTVMSNHHLRDKRLSLKAKGLMSYMLSLPNEWDFSVSGLSACLPEGKDAIVSAMKELEAYNYLVREQIREQGKFKTNYTLFENPKSENRCGYPAMVFPLRDIQGGKFKAENPQQINTSIASTYISNTNNKKEKYKKEKPPVESSVGTVPAISSPTVKDIHFKAEFDRLWAMYPIKQGKTKAYEKFKKAVKGGVSVSKMEDGIKRYCLYVKTHNVEKAYIKHGDTWFSQQCWEDEYDLTSPKPIAVSTPTPPKPALYDDPMAGGRWV